MTAEVGVHAVSGVGGDLADRRGDIADSASHHGGADAGIQSLLGCLDEPQIVGLGCADDERHGGIGDPTVDVCREIDAQQIAVLERVIEGQPVQRRIVDRRAQDLAEGARPE